jgi:integrase/recombinase XerD
MKRKPHISKKNDPSRKKSPWLLRWQMEGEQEQRRWFATKAQAVQAAQGLTIQIENHGTKHGTFSDAERSAIIAFRDAVEGLPEPRPTLRDAVNAFLVSIANQLKPVTVSKLVALRLASAEARGVHARTLRDLGGADGKKGRLGAFAAKFGKRQAAAITSEEIEKWAMAHCKTDATRREVLVRINGLFAYGVKCGFVRENPVSRIDKPRPNNADTAILTVKDSAALLNACPVEIIPAVAVQMFAGLRTSEVESLEWERINFESNSIRVTQRKGAGNRKSIIRFVPMLPTLRAWLEPFRKLAGPVFPIAERGPKKGQMSKQVYRVAFAKARKDAGIVSWDISTLRHCFGTYRYADTTNLPQVMAEMGHTEASTTTQHYIDAVTKKDAEAFWGLIPGCADAEKVAEMPTRRIA